MVKRNAFWVFVLALVLFSLACGLGGDEDTEPTEVIETGDTTQDAPADSGDAGQPEDTEGVTPLEGGVQPAPEDMVSRPADEMTMVRISAGEFLMGDDNSPYGPEKPGHLVTLDEYWLDLTEVTNAQYRLCVEAEVCAEPKAWENPEWNQDEMPALVTWQDAADYCQWTGGRLPSEAEWEKGARGTDGRLWPWGHEFEEGRSNLTGEEDGYLAAAPVGSFPAGASPFGLLDMSGNAAEWVADWFGPDYYDHSPSHNPTGPAGGDLKVIRGVIANFGGGPEKSRVVARYGNPTRFEFGFRCAADAPPQP